MQASGESCTLIVHQALAKPQITSMIPFRRLGLFVCAGLLQLGPLNAPLEKLAGVSLCSCASAQLPPKSGREYYEETTRHGFRIRTPKDWGFFPDERGNPNVLGRYVPKRDGTVSQSDGTRFAPTMWLLVFDKSYEAPLIKNQRDAQRAAVTSYYKTLADWLKGRDVDLQTSITIADFEVLDEDESKVKGTLGGHEVLYLAKGEFRGPRGEKNPGSLHFWAKRFVLTEDKEVAVLFSAPSDKRDWSKWRSQIRKIAGTFSRVDLEDLDTSSVSGSGVRAEKHRALLEMVGANPGWELHATPNYFVISNSDDDEFLKEIKDRLEAIREQYEKEFPEELALAASESQKQRRRDARGKNKDGDKPAAPEAELSQVQSASPRELSRCSVVRVCDSREDYMRYGGPAGSAGYWWSATEELVIFDDQATGGRRNTWATLNHEAFHQFIYYFFANLSPGTWYNEGNADFYSGYKLNSRRHYELGRFDWRNSTIKAEIREDKNVPLESLVAATKAQYYARAPLTNPRTGQEDTFSRYPHGWSFMYFLRTGKTNRAKNWEADWDAILPTYLATLIETGDPQAANDAAFTGVDWTALEASWSEYIVRGK